MLTSFKFIILRSFFFFFGGSNSSFQCWSYSFPRVKCFLMPVHLSISHLLLFMCSRVLKISKKICVSILNPLNLFGDHYLKIAWTDWEWKHKSCEISSALQNKWVGRSEWLRGASTWESIWTEERIWSTELELNPPEKKKNEEWWTWNFVSIFLRITR